MNKTAVELRLFKGLHGHTRPQYGCEIGSRTEKHVIIINYLYIYIYNGQLWCYRLIGWSESRVPQTAPVTHHVPMKTDIWGYTPFSDTPTIFGHRTLLLCEVCSIILECCSMFNFLCRITTEFHDMLR